jgi:hypothetical protein
VSRSRDGAIDSQCPGRAVIEQEEQGRYQPVATGQINNATAPETPSHTPGNLPGFKEFFAWQAAGPADGAAKLVEQGVARKEEKFLFGQSVFGGTDHKKSVL